MNKKSKFLKNIKYAFTSQGISLLLSVLMSLLVPKFLGVEKFGYWQLFIFYSGYVGLFQFGLSDGVYLKYGGTTYEDLDKSSIGSQFKFSSFSQTGIALLIIFFALALLSEEKRIFVFIAVAIYLLMNNLWQYLGNIFQAVNETRIYSISVLIEKLISIISIVCLILIKIDIFEIYIIMCIFAKFIALIYCMYMGKEILFAKKLPLRLTIIESIYSSKIGINLMLANVASPLIIGVGRFIIDRVWGVNAFGKFSLSVSLTNFFLQFISQVSMVLFPVLRQSNEEQLKKIYKTINDALAIIMPMVLLTYIPMKVVLGLWLPEYKISLEYLALLLPICIYNGKMNMLCITYFKVLRKEKFLLKANMIAVGMNLILSLFGALLLKSIYSIIVFMFLTTAFRSIISEVYLAKLMKAKVIISIIEEFALVVVFMLDSWYLSSALAFVIYLIVYVMYLILNYGNLKSTFNFVRSKFAGKATN